MGSGVSSIRRVGFFLNERVLDVHGDKMQRHAESRTDRDEVGCNDRDSEIETCRNATRCRGISKERIRGTGMRIMTLLGKLHGELSCT